MSYYQWVASSPPEYWITTWVVTSIVYMVMGVWLGYGRGLLAVKPEPKTFIPYPQGWAVQIPQAKGIHKSIPVEHWQYLFNASWLIVQFYNSREETTLTDQEQKLFRAAVKFLRTAILNNSNEKSNKGDDDGSANEDPR